MEKNVLRILYVSSIAIFCVSLLPFAYGLHISEPSSAPVRQTAFNELLWRIFGHPRTLYVDPSMGARDVIKNISFVPTRWADETDSPVGSVDADGRIVVQWKGVRRGDPISNNTRVQYSCATPRTLVIYAETPSDAAYGLGHYLKHFLNSSIAWGVDGTGYNIVIPREGLAASCRRQSGTQSSNDSVVTIESLGRYRYYYNVCAHGYTTAFWDWADRWEQEIDWMALHGLNLVLVGLPTEFIWILTYREFGLDAASATSYFTGPAFLPWNRMGNIKAWAGPASPAFFEQQFKLALRIVDRMRSLGIDAVLPAFDGHVSDAFVEKYKDKYPGDFVRGPDWGGGGEKYTMNYILLPSSPLFQKVGEVYIKHVVDSFGQNTFFAADTWNEMIPTSSDPAFLKQCGEAVIQAIHTHAPNAIWVLQGWTFYNERRFWSRDRVQTYLSGVPVGSLLVLDLTSDNNPVYPWTDSYFGHWFIWNTLHNYGGKRGIYGAMDVLAEVPADLFASGEYPSIKGVGTAPEATEHNPIFYELLFDVAWGEVRSAAALRQWLPLYAAARYGTAVVGGPGGDGPGQSVRPMLAPNGAYTIIPPCCNHFVSYEQRPWITYEDFTRNPIGTTTDYDPDTIVDALRLLLRPFAAMGANGWAALATAKVPGVTTYRYDLVDYLRQVIGNIFTDAHFGGLGRYLEAAFPTTKSTPPEEVQRCTRELRGTFAKVMQDAERLVALDDNFQLGRWLQQARAVAPAGEEGLFRFNALRQVTLWGPKEAPDIHDYAAKQWNGLIRAFYVPRWSLFFDFLADHIIGNGGKWTMPDGGDEWNTETITKIEDPIAFTNETFPVSPSPPLPEAYGVIEALADTYLPDWRGDTKWGDGYDIYHNVSVSDSPYDGPPFLYRSWHRTPSILHGVCRMLPRCTAFLGLSRGGRVYAFGRPSFTKGGLYTLYVKK